MRILILGAGGIGGFFGGYLARSGADVSFLVRENRRMQLTEGLLVESPLGDFSVPVNLVDPDRDAAPFDLVMLTPKSYGLSGALEAISPFVGPDTGILPFLNGIGHIELIQKRFSGRPVLGGVAQIAVTLTEDGIVRHLNTLKTLIVGALNHDDRAQGYARRFVELALAAGIDASLEDDIEQALWDKWVFLATLAGATCTMRAAIGPILRSEGGKAFLTGLHRECIDVATAEGHSPGEEIRQFHGRFFSDETSDFTASMLRDIQAGGPTEGEHILGDMNRRGKRHRIATPFLDAAWVHLQCYEMLRAAR